MQIRRARPDEVAVLNAIDDDASTLFREHDLPLAPEQRVARRCRL
jgi:hypothetical protein